MSTVSTVFVSWAAEETGLLGAEYYAANPVWPLETTVANIIAQLTDQLGPLP